MFFTQKNSFCSDVLSSSQELPLCPPELVPEKCAQNHKSQAKFFEKCPKMDVSIHMLVA